MKSTAAIIQWLEEMAAMYSAAAQRMRELHLVEQKHLAMAGKEYSMGIYNLPGQLDLSERTDLHKPHRDGHPSFLEDHGGDHGC